MDTLRCKRTLPKRARTEQQGMLCTTHHTPTLTHHPWIHRYLCLLLCHSKISLWHYTTVSTSSTLYSTNYYISLSQYVRIGLYWPYLFITTSVTIHMISLYITLSLCITVTVYHCICPYVSLYHYTSLHLPLCITVSALCISVSVTLYHYTPIFVTVHHHLSLKIALTLYTILPVSVCHYCMSLYINISLDMTISHGVPLGHCITSTGIT